MPHIDMIQSSTSDSLKQDGVTPWNVHQLVQAAVDRWTIGQEQREQARATAQSQGLNHFIAAQFVAHEHRRTQIVTGEANHRCAQYATHDEVTNLQEEIDRLSILVANLGRKRRDRPAHGYSSSEYRRDARTLPTSERELSPLGNVSDDEYPEDRQPLRCSAPRHEYRSRDRNSTAYGLHELERSDPRFSDILSYRRYRLADQDYHFGPEKQLDNEEIPEAGALRIWPNFLSSEALELFNRQSEEGDAHLGGFTRWPEAVHFFLRTYSK
eukprot:IDg9684t1